MASWSLTGNLAVKKGFASIVKLQDGTVLSIGGYNAGGLTDVELYSPSTGLWTTVQSLPSARDVVLPFVLSNGKVLIVGGADNITAVCDLYDPNSQTWTATGSLPAARWGGAGFQLSNGKILYAGGFTTNGITSPASDAYLYDPNAGTWSVTGSLHAPKALAMYALSGSGKPVVLGGDDSGSTVSSTIEVYNVGSGTWTVQSSTLPSPAGKESGGFGTVTLNDGTILLVGGRTAYQTDVSTSPHTYTYDADADTLTQRGDFVVTRTNFASFKLSDGRVVIAGGTPGSDSAPLLSSTEVYTPGTGLWTAGPNLVIQTSIVNQIPGPVLNSGLCFVPGGFSQLLGPNQFTLDTQLGDFMSTTQIDENQIANSTVTPGSYTSANITVSAQGLITAAANGSGGASPVVAKYNSNAALTVSGSTQVVKYQNMEIDTNSAYSSSTGLFTCPTTGSYRITASMLFSPASSSTTNRNDYMKIQKNGTDSNIISLFNYQVTGVTLQAFTNGSSVLSCTAGDTLAVGVLNDGTFGSQTLDTTNPSAFSYVAFELIH